MNYYIAYFSPIGKITLSSNGESLNGLWLQGQKYHGNTDLMTRQDDLPVFTAVKKWLDDYFAAKNPDVKHLPIVTDGSVFRQKVWELLRLVPYGTTISYSALASLLQKSTGKPACSRAVGGAVGHNPISIIIPCHRVVGAKGNLTGYAGGLSAKQFLLRLEQEKTSLGKDMN